jgi:hypothetical protein
VLARGSLAATGNSNFGYFGGGNPSPLSTVDRIDYSNDTATAPTKGPLSSGRQQLAATSSRANALPTTETIVIEPSGLTNFATGAVETFQTGYFGGGGPGPLSTVDRIDYSNDTATASPKGPLSLARFSLAATGNSNFGYFGGGAPGPLSTVDRIDYSNDTATASPKVH